MILIITKRIDIACYKLCHIVTHYSYFLVLAAADIAAIGVPYPTSRGKVPDLSLQYLFLALQLLLLVLVYLLQRLADAIGVQNSQLVAAPVLEGFLSDLLVVARGHSQNTTFTLLISLLVLPLLLPNLQLYVVPTGPQVGRPRELPLAATPLLLVLPGGGVCRKEKGGEEG